jgi:hypothetical protein
MVSSGMLRRVAVVRTDVSEEPSASLKSYTMGTQSSHAGARVEHTESFPAMFPAHRMTCPRGWFEQFVRVYVSATVLKGVAAGYYETSYRSPDDMTSILKIELVQSFEILIPTYLPCAMKMEARHFSETFDLMCQFQTPAVRMEAAGTPQMVLHI